MELLERVTRHYCAEGYALVAEEVRLRGVCIPLVCERRREVAFVLLSAEEPTEPERDALNRALCEFLRRRRASGVGVRWDRACLIDDDLVVVEDAFPVRDPEAG